MQSPNRPGAGRCRKVEPALKTQQNTSDASCAAYVGGSGSVYRVPLTTGAAVPGPEELRAANGPAPGQPWEPHLHVGYLEAQTCRWRGRKEQMGEARSSAAREVGGNEDARPRSKGAAAGATQPF